MLADLHYNLLDRVYTQHSNGYQEKCTPEKETSGMTY